MNLKTILHLVIIVGVALIQLAFIQVLPAWFGSFNLVLVLLVFVLTLSGLSRALMWAVGIGFIFDIYNFFAFGLFMICFLIVVMSAYFLLNHFFTDLSLFSYLALTLIITFIYEMVFHLGVSLASWPGQDTAFFLTTSEFWGNFFQGIILNLGGVIILFYFFNFVSDRLSAVFLKR